MHNNSRRKKARLIAIIVAFLCWVSYSLFSRILVLGKGAGDIYSRRSLEDIDVFALFFLSAIVASLLLVPAISRLVKLRSQKKPAKPLTRKGLFFGLITILLTSSIILCAWYLIHFRYVRSLKFYSDITRATRKPPVLPLLNAEEGKSLGWSITADSAPTLSFLHYPFAKKPGTIRIGIFGCSFVKGREGVYGDEFPSFLQRKLHRISSRPVEVINFGVDGYGMHQSWLLWSYLGKKYDLR